MTPREYENRWIDDCLDLYNWAKQLGDDDWQVQLLAQLRGVKRLAAQAAAEDGVWQLWRNYELVHRQLRELGKQIRRTGNVQDLMKMKRQMWDLKLQRMRIAKQLKAV